MRTTRVYPNNAVHRCDIGAYPNCIYRPGHSMVFSCSLATDECRTVCLSRGFQLQSRCKRGFVPMARAGLRCLLSLWFSSSLDKSHQRFHPCLVDEETCGDLRSLLTSLASTYFGSNEKRRMLRSARYGHFDTFGLAFTCKSRCVEYSGLTAYPNCLRTPGRSMQGAALRMDRLSANGGR